ncbi:MAG: hypothetical protein E6H57_00440 [Betaproteobacteria bacterium]|nr:MAG: hypothetical protein E6H57_00440 [Betaproteobacteria bacterium]
MLNPGRSCPTSYRYGAHALRGEPSLQAESLWIAGGLYGNPLALEALLEAYDCEHGRKALVFNGDFHWFDVDVADFGRINDAVLAFHATRGNVETELATPQDGAGCGCGYPDWVGDDTVQRSNRIIERLRATAARLPHTLALLRALPMHLGARVGDACIAIVHGDADSLAGWNFSQEALATDNGLANARKAFDAAGADVFASSHTCLPVLQCFPGGKVLVNNGAAGMPNFRGEHYGLATRIALTPAPNSVYGMRQGGLYIDAVPLRYDTRAWEQRFLEQWPAGSDAHASYYARIMNGPDYSRQAALRLTDRADRQAPETLRA